jgi:peptidoglycan/LPS O-acetylase OafA/YrhL
MGFEKQIPGGLGVNIFFYISGLLITNLLLVEYTKTGTINFKNFFIRRILRLYPPLLVMITLICIVPGLRNELVWGEVLAAIFYYENYYNIHNFYIIHDNLARAKFRIIWSLSIEEHFYLVFPFLFYFFIDKKKVLITIISVVIFAALALRIYIAYIYNSNAYADNYTYQATLCRADSIMMGCLSSIIIFFDTKKIYVKFVSLYPVFIGSVILIFSSLLIRSPFFRETIRFTMQSVACMCIVPAILYSNKYTPLNKLLSSAPFVFVGRLSYSLYLFHIAFYKFSSIYIVHQIRTWEFSIVGLIGAFTLASISYFAIEKPIMSLRRKFGSVAVK